MNFLKYMWLTILVVVAASFINVTHAAYENSVAWFNILTTLLFLTYWWGFGFYTGCKRDKSFLVFTILFFLFNLAIAIGHNYKVVGQLYIFPVVSSFLPMYGLYYFFRKLLSESDLIRNCALLVFPFMLAILGYFQGLIKQRRKLNTTK